MGRRGDFVRWALATGIFEDGSNVIVNDAFEDTDNVTLENHIIRPVNKYNQSWVVSTVGNIKIVSNRATLAAASTRYGYVDARIADVHIQATVVTGETSGTTELSAVLIRFQDAGHHYRVGINKASNQFYLIELNVTSSVKASAEITYGPNETHVIDVWVKGATILATLDGAAPISYTSTLYETETKHGIVLATSATITNYPSCEEVLIEPNF